jgi:hypothetical protein
MFSTSAGLAANFSSINGTEAWDPETTMPPLGLDATTAATSEYTQARSSFYLSAAKKLTESLVVLSPAYWDNIYLETEKRIAPLKLTPPVCSKTSRILIALSDYMSNVKRFTSYATSMTEALMSLTPVSIAIPRLFIFCGRFRH